LAVHGGAGTIPARALNGTLAEAHHAALRAALAAGFAVLQGGGSALDAVTAAVTRLEDDELFNAGRGAVFTSAGRLEMDAGIMDGAARAAGAVAGVCGPKNPILAARAVMERSENVLLIGAGAEAFLREQNIPFEEPAYFTTQRRLDALQLELDRRASGTADTRSDADRHGTVGAVARDALGNLAAGTSTGGITAKRPGRVGDTPVVGAGVFADNASCAVSATGTGEVFIRFTAAAEIAARVKYGGQALARAAEDVVHALLAHGGDGGLIALGREGPPALPFNSSGMYRGFVTADGVCRTAIHREAWREDMC
jgi:beta-aspartyl-peptidase (threonine type)